MKSMAKSLKAQVLSALYAVRRAFFRLRKPLTVGVRCIVARDDEAVLLVRHSYIDGWFLPGGGVERGETLEAAIGRELWEEVGVVPRERPQVFHAYSNFNEWKSDHVVLYVVRRFDIEPRPNIEIIEHGFFAPDGLPADTTPATARRLMEWRGAAVPGADW
jgi:ADP-ribose pyrophosphatase YjhB (NUDIX family)